jgi:hypothetical protein
LKARSGFLRTGAEFSFDGDMNKKPIIQYWFHPFVVRGRQEKHPDLGHKYHDLNHYADYHLNYHIMDRNNVPKGEMLTYGFKIDTREGGNYKLIMAITADGELAKSSLILWVKDPPYSEKFQCVGRGDNGEGRESEHIVHFIEFRAAGRELIDR